MGPSTAREVGIPEPATSRKYFWAKVSIQTLAVRLTDGGEQIKYLLLIHANEQAWSEPERVILWVALLSCLAARRVRRLIAFIVL